ncbi:MAG TPA: ATP-binding cassette domain-containing protein, partial [Ignavibacteriaceae bacterium]
MKNKIIFELNDVNVEFEKHAIQRRSLRETVGSILKSGKSEKIHALKNINLKIYGGEHIGVIGRNGAGKSTLLKVLAGVIIPSRGKVFKVNSYHIAPLLELGIG